MQWISGGEGAQSAFDGEYQFCIAWSEKRRSWIWDTWFGDMMIDRGTAKTSEAAKTAALEASTKILRKRKQRIT